VLDRRGDDRGEHTLGEGGVMADSVYSITLLFALVAGVVAIVGGLGALVARESVVRWSRWTTRSSVLAWLCLLISVGVHLAYGHRPGTRQAMGVFEFVREHVAFAVAVLLPCAALLIRRRVARADVASRRPTGG
jgi:hypothetical protein